MTTRHWLLVIVLVGGALRFVPIWFGLPFAHARPDETIALGLAEQIRNGDLNPHFFHWGSLTLYVFAAVHALISVCRRAAGFDSGLSFETLVISARAVVALAGTLTILVLFRLARRMAGPATGLIAALFLAVAILHVRDSHFAMTDILMTFLLTTSLALLLEALEHAPNSDRALRTFAAAGFAGGLATSTKYNAGAILAAMGAAQLVWISRAGVRPLSTRAWLPTLALLVSFAVGFVVGTPYAILDFSTFAADVRFDMTHLAGGHGIDLGRGWQYHLIRSLPYGLGIPVFVAALAGIVPLGRHYPRQAFVLLTFAAAFYGSIGSGQTVFFRYVLPLVPVLCLTAAVAVERLASWTAARTRFSTATATMVLAMLVAAPSLVNSVWFDVLLSRTDSRVLALEWLAPRVRDADTVFDAGGSYAELNLAPAKVHHWKYDPATESFEGAAGRTPDWLVLHESPLFNYTPKGAFLFDLAHDRYDLVLTVTASSARARRSVYDLQDAFFMPVAGFAAIERPGPTIRVYRRRDAPPLPDALERSRGFQP